MEKDKIASLATEQRNPNTENIDMVDTITMIKMLGTEYLNVGEAVLREADAISRAVDCITERMLRGGRLVYIGAGTSGRLGVLDASECPPTFSLPEGVVVGLIAGGDKALRSAVENIEDDASAAVSQLKALSLNEKDVVCAIAASGRTPYAIGALEYARAEGAAAICVTNSKNSEMSGVSDIAIEVEVGPEPLTGSTRMKSGTAQKIVLNILSTAAMIKQGKTYGNLMVDVSATNQKLRKRSINILNMIFPEKSREEIASVLEKSGGKVKLAAVMLHKSVEPEEGENILKENGGYLRKALEK